MSRASKLTLAGMSFFAAATVGLVHFQQTIEKDGVVRDMEQLRIKQERQLDFDMQRALEEEYKKEQSVHDAIAAAEAQDGQDSQSRGRAAEDRV